MSDLQLTGKLKLVNEIQTFDSGFSKREFVITTSEQYPQDVKFELFKDKTSLIDSSKVGDTLTVSFNIRGNEYNGKYYVSLQAWRIGIEASSQPPQAPTASSEDDGLPF